MDTISANYFSVGMIGNEVHLRIGTYTPVYDVNGNRAGNEKVKEIVAVMSPESIMGLRKVIDNLVNPEQKEE